MWNRICFVRYSPASNTVGPQAPDAAAERLMHMAIPEMFSEPEPYFYAHTPYSLVYKHPGIRGAFKLMWVSTFLS